MSNEELYQIKGGASKWGFGIIVGAIISLVTGIIDGFLRPLPCND